MHNGKVSFNINTDKEGRLIAPHQQAKWIGTDEAGKGDYFGPLVAAGVLVDNALAKSLWQLGVKDSKQLSDNAISKLAITIKKVCQYSVVVIGPAKYNELYAKMRNLNRLLAWGHARVIENILDKEVCEYALSDQFGDEKFITQALMKKGRRIVVRQKTRAETDIGVAAASILARDEFVCRLALLSKQYSMDFPKGASNAVVEAGKGFLDKYGKERLKEVAKVHFKTTKLVLAE